MIRRLLIANRGEIVARIARSAAAMGIRTVVAYAEGDRHAPFVTAADLAVPLPGRTATETYLNVDALLTAARAGGADAVHPGYGFLSEQPAFARAVIGAGLRWVGPLPEVIAAMGDKVEAKQRMVAAGVPVLPTWEPADPAVRFPVLVKAAAGGGGKGMRVVERPGDLPEALSAATREASAAFGDPRVFLEPYLADTRHVEIQIVADDHGHTVHCFERECSIQRRHQKVIEEAPSPALDDDLRDRMGRTALAAARAVGYTNAGTVEFILEPDGHYWFLEVNARLQVEHPVTEAVTGFDLVREQLLVAQGAPLSVAQSDLAIDGHAVEARIYAEDPAAGFLPSVGTLADWAPAGDPAVRWDSGVETGSVIGVEFDPMLAKVISHAPTRTEAANRLALALERSRIRGVTTNRDFLVAALRHPQFLAGEATTSFVDRSGVPLARVVTPEERGAAAVAAALSLRAEAMTSARVVPHVLAGWRNSVMPPERRVFEHAGEEIVVTYTTNRDGTLDFGDRTVRLVAEGGGRVGYEEVVGGSLLRHSVHVLHRDGDIWVQGPDGDVQLAVVGRFPEIEVAAVAGGLRAPMPGRVILVKARPGQQVEVGDVLVVVEAMKMEHQVLAPRAGTVREASVQVGDQVDRGALLVVVEELG